MDGIIFDVDGTIWDASDVIRDSWNEGIQMYSDLEQYITPELLAQLLGKTMEDIWAILFPTLPKEEQLALGDLCTKHENVVLETRPGTLYEGMEEVLSTLAQNQKLYIVSNCQPGYIEVMLKVTGLGKYVQDHLCYGDTLLPKSQTIQQLMERNQLQDVVYIGDTRGDYEACKEIDIPFIFVEFGFGDVSEAEAPVRAKKALDLLDILAAF